MLRAERGGRGVTEWQADAPVRDLGLARRCLGVCYTVYDKAVHPGFQLGLSKVIPASLLQIRVSCSYSCPCLLASHSALKSLLFFHRCLSFLLGCWTKEPDLAGSALMMLFPFRGAHPLSCLLDCGLSDCTFYIYI